MVTDIEKIINECKKELDEYFCEHPFAVWKEEDLQSHLYYLLLKQDHSLYSRVHREFPVVIQSEPRVWSGMLDIVILEEYKGDFNLSAKIDYAIELKFMREYQSGRSKTSLVDFRRECIKDRDKLLSDDALNFYDKTKKYFWAFRYVDEPQIDEVNELMNGIDWGNVIWQYTESYSDGSESKTIGILP